MSPLRKAADDLLLDVLWFCALHWFRMAGRVRRWLGRGPDGRHAAPGTEPAGQLADLAVIVPLPLPERPQEPTAAETTAYDLPFGPLRIRRYLDEPEQPYGDPAEARGALVAMQAAGQVLSWGWPR
jgi:hypothetical protein